MIEQFTTYTSRHYGTVVRMAHSAAGFIIERADGMGEVFLPASEARLAGVALQIADQVEFAVIRGRALRVSLATFNGGTRHRVLSTE